MTASSTPTFHSQNIADTKAREKREVFVHVEEKKTIKQSAEEFQKKFAEARAHAAESRAKIENPGADANGIVASREHRFSPAKILKIFILVVILGIIGLVVYLNWDTIYQKFFEASEEKAMSLLADNPEDAGAMFVRIVNKASDPEQKEANSLWYAQRLLNLCLVGDEYHCSNQVLEEMRKLAEIAENISPSSKSAIFMANYYRAKNDTTNFELWYQRAQERQTE